MIPLRKIFLILFLPFASRAFCQFPDSFLIDSLSGKFIKSLRLDGKEEIFLHTNKSFYRAGEEIWFRAYCINTLSHKIMQQSKSLFVDLVSDQDSLVSQIMLNNGLLKLDGFFNLPATLPEGVYWLRAFTRQQIMHDPLSVYIQPLYVFNPTKRDSTGIARQINDPVSATSDSGEISMKFYPEGGSIISGSEIKLAFKTLGGPGRPLDVFGYVTDNANQVVAKYSTTTSGLGSFTLFFDSLKQYTAHTIYGGGKMLNTPLPVANPFGYLLSIIRQSDDSIFVQVSLGDSVYKKYRTTYVLGVNRDSLCFAAVGKDMYRFSIPKSNFPVGKASLLLFNDEQEVVSQRDLYIQGPKSDLVIVPDRARYGPREKVKLSITPSQNASNLADAIFSISVTVDRKVNGNYGQISLNHIDNDDIESGTYSSIQGDLVMLTQPLIYLGWPKNSHINFMGQPKESSDSNVTRLTGQVLNRKSLPEKNKIVTLVSNIDEHL